MPAWKQIESEGAGHRLPRDRAPNKALLKAVVDINTGRVLQCS
jgi:hypothetical protein